MSERTKKPCVLLGVTGSIAAYKAADVASRLAQSDIDVHVLMTSSATELVQPRTFQTVTRQPVVTDLWQLPDWQPGHIALADKGDVLLVAPATANMLAKMARGIADDALSTQALSHEGPVLVAPAMNPRMWRHPAVRENVSILRDRGVRFLGPDAGAVACGDSGTGRMAAPAQIVEAVRAHLALLRTSQLANRTERLLVTAGPTRESLDPVRFLSNRSTGRMGYAVAAAGVAAGMDVTLISGPTNLLPPAGCRMVSVDSAAEMAETVREALPRCDWLVMAAAVADYRPPATAPEKIVKTNRRRQVELERTEDILEWVAAHRTAGQIVIGFAAETTDAETRGAEKRKRKQLDWIAVNDVGRPDIGFGASENEVVLLSAHHRIPLPKACKLDVAAQLLGTIAEQR